ncbi:MAG: diguanylate cyclase [Gammaproteobacteria bacterium]|nr:diguanylate cyclase [Gammaproteobacteria bacterium]
MATGKKYKNIYLGTLVFIAALITASIIIIDYIAAEESRMIEVNDIGGRQRMLSERTVHLLLEYAVETDPAARDRIVELIDLVLIPFDRTHNLLIRGQLPNGQMVIFSDNIDDIFFDAPEYLDKKARIFIYNTREVLERGWSPTLVSNYYFKQLRAAAKQDLHSSLQVLAAQYTENSKVRITRLRMIVAMLLGGIVVVLFGVGAFVLIPMFRRIENQERELHKQAFIDPLTNCHNRRSFLTNAATAFERSRRYNHSFALLYIDIDHFKAINDTYGHAVGDEAIKQMTRICQENIRESDILGRLGGDEFGIILQECDLGYAIQTAEKLRARVSEHIIAGDTMTIRLSISIGAVTVLDRDDDAFDILRRADKNLYEAKQAGRNLVIAA